MEESTSMNSTDQQLSMNYNKETGYENNQNNTVSLSNVSLHKIHSR